MNFIAPNGRLYYEFTHFRKMVTPIEGIQVTELWCDSFQLNEQKGDEILFRSDKHFCPFKVVEHYDKVDEFIEKGGGFRLDFFTPIHTSE